MKRALFIVTGAAAFAAVGFIMGSLLTNWYSDRFAKSDDDINTSVFVFMLIWPAFACIGGYLGNRLFRSRSLTFPSNRHTTAGHD
jgi:tryptophan-rich sensory protein